MTKPIPGTTNMNMPKENGPTAGESSLRPVVLAPLGEEPLVSVLITNYNYEAYLPSAIDSVLHQTYRNFEIIICDDGSTDSSRKILTELSSRHSCIRPVFQRNQGQSLATRSAFAASRGEVICLLDADDCFLPTKLEETICTFRQDSNTGLIGHPVMTVDTEGRSLGILPLLAAEGKAGWFAHELVRSGGTLTFRCPLNGIALRRGIAELLFEWMDERTIPDELVWALAPFVTGVGWSQKVLAVYRIHAGSRARSGVQNECEGYQRRIEFARNTHHVQAEFLRQYAPDQLIHFPSFEKSLGFAEAEYIRARLAGTEWQEAYRSFRTHESWASLGRAKTLFYKATSVAPYSVARSALRAAHGHNRLKNVVRIVSQFKIIRGLLRAPMRHRLWRVTDRLR